MTDHILGVDISKANLDVHLMISCLSASCEP